MPLNPTRKKTSGDSQASGGVRRTYRAIYRGARISNRCNAKDWLDLLVSATPFLGADARAAAVCHSVAVGVELVGAGGEVGVGGAAGLSLGGIARKD
jgi:hypothetical protein